MGSVQMSVTALLQPARQHQAMTWHPECRCCIHNSTLASSKAFCRMLWTFLSILSSWSCLMLPSFSRRLAYCLWESSCALIACIHGFCCHGQEVAYWAHIVGVLVRPDRLHTWVLSHGQEVAYWAYTLWESLCASVACLAGCVS